jgi:hypothetical protein
MNAYFIRNSSGRRAAASNSASQSGGMSGGGGIHIRYNSRLDAGEILHCFEKTGTSFEVEVRGQSIMQNGVRIVPAAHTDVDE